MLKSCTRQKAASQRSKRSSELRMRFQHGLVWKMARDQGGQFLASDITGSTYLHPIVVNLAITDLCDWGFLRRIDHNEFIVVKS